MRRGCPIEFNFGIQEVRMGQVFTRFVGGVALAAALLAAPSLAFAQWNNEPYQFRNSPTGSGVGMSLGYRQAILMQEIENRRPGTLLRGADGGLIEVRRFQRQAFAVTPETEYLRPATRPMSATRGWAADPWNARSSDPIDSWTAMLD